MEERGLVFHTGPNHEADLTDEALAGATAALSAVTGANAEIARYWLLWLATKA